MKKLKTWLKQLLSIHSVSFTFDLERARKKIKNQEKELEPEKIYLA